MSGISLQQVLEDSPEETDVESTYLVTIKNGVIKKVAAASFSIDSPFAAKALYGLDNGNNQPGTVLQTEIDRLMASGVPESSIIWFSIGTEVAGLGGIASLSSIVANSVVNAFNAIGVSIGVANLTGLNVSTSVADCDGIGTILGNGLATFDSISTNTSTQEIGGIGVALGLGLLSGVFTLTSTADISDTGISIGIGDLSGVSAVSSVDIIVGTGPAAVVGAGSLTGVSAATSITAIDSNAAPYATGVTFTNFNEPVLGISDLTGVLVASSIGTITGVGISPNGSGSLTGVSTTTSTAAIGSNAAPFATAITFSNFS